MWRRKSVPAWPGEELVPVIHGRAPGATRRALNRLARRRAREGPVGPRGSSGWHSVGLGCVFGFALLEPEALAIHLEDMDVVGQAVEERAGGRIFMKLDVI